MPLKDRIRNRWRKIVPFSPEAWLALVLLSGLLVEVVGDVTIERALMVPPEQQIVLRTVGSVLWIVGAYALLYRQLIKQPAALTPREREVFILAGQGMTNRQIAEALSISERTVDTYVMSIRKKLGLSSRAELVKRANNGKRT